MAKKSKLVILWSLLVLLTLSIVFGFTILEKGWCGFRGGEKIGLYGPEKNDCVIPYSDAGRSCTDSSQCQGGCLLPVEGPNRPKDLSPGCQFSDVMGPITCSEKIIGQCAKFPAEDCSWRWLIYKDGFQASLVPPTSCMIQ